MRQEHTLSNEDFDVQSINRFASLMAIGNGYLGIRSTYEEDYPEQTRGMYVCGVYNKAVNEDTSELVNLPDLIGMQIHINGHVFSMQDGKIILNKRYLCFDTGELIRRIVWEKERGERYRLELKRFASKKNLHMFAQKISITSLDKPADISVTTGIDGQQTNHGKQHLVERNVRVIQNQHIQTVFQTTQSKINLALTSSYLRSPNSEISFSAKNRRILAAIREKVSINTPFTIEKLNTVYTSIDEESNNQSIENIGISTLLDCLSKGYEKLLKESADQWALTWKRKRIKIFSDDPFDQLAADFAVYHLEIMTPAHDDRLSVGAKGLTGEGYKGHTFWDTEIFILPFHLYTNHNIARQLLHYRFLRLKQAQKKAKRNSYEGALFPWESAFSGDEETPPYAAINIRTGNRETVASANAEHHIVADIAYSVIQYYHNTNDEDFLREEGIPLLKETSLFWISRAEPDEKNGRLIIKNVIGPDEYTEHIDNNAYTNYMAYYNVEQTILLMNKLHYDDESFLKQGNFFIKHLYLPVPNSQLIIPQDDTFLGKKEIDLSKYREKQGSQDILLDYSRPEVNEMQVIKQADVVMLLFMFQNLFSSKIIDKNLKFYEKRTVHDSSLSKAIHSIVAARIGLTEKAYIYFREACSIDLGRSSHSASEGIHAASIGAIWLMIVFGFVNLSVKNNRLIIDPHLPEKWSKLQFTVDCLNNTVHIEISHNGIVATKSNGSNIQVNIKGKQYILTDNIKVNF